MSWVSRMEWAGLRVGSVIWARSSLDDVFGHGVDWLADGR